mmetsp:Transcript_1806/g.5478  ORF Transcript_1806/g.5478 Transcript_1806/m.5478 type:complete len:154 (-) Transcript_1806:433-894(-)
MDRNWLLRLNLLLFFVAAASCMILDLPESGEFCFEDSLDANVNAKLSFELLPPSFCRIQVFRGESVIGESHTERRRELGDWCFDVQTSTAGDRLRICVKKDENRRQPSNYVKLVYNRANLISGREPADENHVAAAHTKVLSLIDKVSSARTGV